MLFRSDFNNILTVITGTIEILADAVRAEPQLAAITRMIDEAASRGADLTQHLLAFARKQPLEPKETDVNAEKIGWLALLIIVAAGMFLLLLNGVLLLVAPNERRVFRLQGRCRNPSAHACARASVTALGGAVSQDEACLEILPALPSSPPPGTGGP